MGETTAAVVIVLNWNNEADTAACLESIGEQRDASFEVLMVDNASADGSGDRLHQRYPDISYLQTGTNLGYAGGNNRGIEWALKRGAEWIIVLNNDTVLAPHCFRCLLDVAQGEPRVGALSPLVTRYDDPSRVWFAGGHLSVARAVGVHEAEHETVASRLAGVHGRSWIPCSFLSGCCLLLRAETLRAVGVFREDFFAYVEDVELSLRLVRAGWELGWVPGARLAHRVPKAGAPESPMQIRLRDRNRRRLVRDSYPMRWRVLFAAWFWPTRLIHLFRYSLHGDGSRARAILAGMVER
ncbi:MAG: glycosyltransferase family 2 protein [Gemmatimonadota bacterium]|nr:glycosyltransferase family 2 protein [Gemmatimonadota bacterium]